MNPNSKTQSLPFADPTSIQQLLAMRETQKSIKDRLSFMDQAVEKVEGEILAQIEAGADFGPNVSIQSVSRRFPAWKEHFISKLGKTEADAVLEATVPVIYRRLVIK